MKKGSVCYTRGLATVLLAITMSTFSVNSVQAATVDDLRAYLGMTVETREPTMIKNPNLATGQSDTSVKTPKKSEEAVTLEQLKSNLIKLEGAYEQGLKDNTKAVSLLDLLKAVHDTKTKIDEQSNIAGTISNVDVNALIKNSAANEMELQTAQKLGSNEYNIGDVGNMAVSPSDKTLSLVTPYGYKLKPDGSHEDKNSSIDLSVPVGYNVLAQWNGKIAYIEDDEASGYKVVTIFHGQKLYTVYHHVIPGQIYVGKSVGQGSVIGTAGDTTKLEPNKGNHIKYQIILDEKYVNPILIFGDRSKGVYEDWLKKSYEQYTVEVGEEFYYVSSMSKSNPNRDKPKQNTIQGAIEVEGDYVKPDPGVVK